MIRLTKQECLGYLESDYDITLSSKGKTYVISVQTDLIWTREEGLISANDRIQIKLCEDERNKRELFVDTFEEIKAFFGQDENEAFILVDTLRGYHTMEEFQRSLDFDNASMEYLLEKYSDCDTFALCGFHYEKVSQSQAEKILRNSKERGRDALKELYERAKEKYPLEPFEVLYQKIGAECAEFDKRQSERDARQRAFYLSGFISGQVGKSTQYSEPKDFFWRFYHTLGFLLDHEYELEHMVQNGKKTHPAAVLNRKAYAPLKPDYLGYELTFETHCNVSSTLYKQMYFRLTENTKAWLRTHKNDYDFEGPLQDLAFFKNGKLRFSSCTHEEGHEDIP